MTDKDVDDGMVFAQVSIPISDWWGGAHALKKARIDEMQAENDRLEAREMLAVEIERTWSEVQEAHAQILLMQRSVASATENLRQNRNFYDAGTATLTDLLDAETLYTQSRNDLTSRHGAVRVRQAFDKYIRQSGGSVVLPDTGCFPRRRMRVAIFSRLHWVMKSALSAASSPISGRIMG